MATEPLHAVRACRKCGIIKPATTDYFHRHGKRWLRTVCRDCTVGQPGYSDRKIRERQAGIKVCRACETEKPHTAEHFVSKLGKLTPLCRQCNAEISKRRYEANRESALASMKRYREQNREAVLAGQRRYYREHIDERKIYDKAYADANRERRIKWHRDWARSNPERVAFYNRRYQQTPAGKDSQKRRQARWLERHGDRIRADRRAKYYENHDSHLSYQRQYYADNKERFRELARQWNRKNKHKRKAIDHRRRVGNGSGKMFSASDVETIMSEQGGACSYCLADLTEYFEADHFIPLAKGGGNEPENIVLTCFPCNRSKGAKMPWVWRPDLFREPP